MSEAGFLYSHGMNNSQEISLVTAGDGKTITVFYDAPTFRERHCMADSNALTLFKSELKQ